MVIVKMPERIKPRFSRYIGIDYSGAETPDSSLKGLRVYEANREPDPVEVEPPPSPRKYWTRRGLAEWLVARLSDLARHGLSSSEPIPNFPQMKSSWWQKCAGSESWGDSQVSPY